MIFKALRIMCICLLMAYYSHGQNITIPIYLPEYHRYISIPDDTKLNDTVIIKHTEKIFFKFVFFDFRGKSYLEVYKNKKIVEKGYLENSLDTLKCYISTVKGQGLRGNIKLMKYFEPLKNGEWVEIENGKLVKKKYNMGEGMLRGKE